MIRMLCNQCEQTAGGVACTRVGVCGKEADIAAIQDSIVYAARGLALALLQTAGEDRQIYSQGRLLIAALFSTLTNVNFDRAALLSHLRAVTAARDQLLAGRNLPGEGPLVWQPSQDDDAACLPLEAASIARMAPDVDRLSLAQTLLYGLKGVAAYAHHAAALGHEDRELYLGLCRGLVLGFDGNTPENSQWLAALMACGEINIKAMELLDKANTNTYGHPEPVQVPTVPRPGKAILVSGHDLKDLYEILVMTEGLGINVYTHGEMLPCHGYPGLRRFGHLAGHFGTAWQNQQQELPHFPGAILFTTNCIQRPDPCYADRVFTSGVTGWPDIPHLAPGDFEPLIACALASPGFAGNEGVPGGRLLTGFGGKTVLDAAETILTAVRSGAVKHFFLVGGCDGARPGRNYYTRFVEATPTDSLVLTLACGKFRFLDKDLGTAGGLPRILDIGQCNDAYSAVRIASALAEALECGVNDLPLSFVLSWYEQKAVAILLSLLYLGVTGIRLGPSLPAFLSPAVTGILAEQFGIRPIGEPEADLRDCLAGR